MSCQNDSVPPLSDIALICLSVLVNNVAGTLAAEQSFSFY